MRRDKRRRPAFVERRHQHVRGHDRRDAGLDGGLERHELDRAQPIGRVLDERQLEVGIGARVAVPRESACRRRRCPPPAAPARSTRPEARDVLGLLGQRPIADDRVLRVGVDVEHRRVVERDADALQLERERPRESLRQRLVAAAPERRHRRPLRERRLQPRDPAALLIDRDPERQLGHEPRRIEGQLGDLLGLGDVAREQDDAAQAELLRERSKLGRNLVAVEAGNQQLTDLTAKVARASCE